MTVPARWPHQEETFNFLLDKPNALILSDPGTGKTRSVIDTFAEWRDQGNTGRMLVVCPSTLMEAAWGADIAKFQPALTVSYAVAGKSKGVSKRTLAFQAPSDIVIINTDGVKWIADYPEMLADFDWLVIDEITAFKHHTAARSKAAKLISAHFGHRIGLTGTWVSKSVTNAWHQALIIDGGTRLGKSFSAFRNQMCTPIDNGFGVEWKDKENARQILALLVKDIAIRHEFDEVMDVPENRSSMRFVKLGTKAKAAYDELEATAMLELEHENVTAVNAAVLHNRLLQVASGAVYGVGDTYHLIDTFRYQFIADLIAEREHSVTFFNWRHQRVELENALTTREIPYAYIDGTVPTSKRAAIVEAFQKGAYQTLLLHPDTGAHGLTVTRANTTIWCSPIYKADFLQQGIHRIYRGGQTQETENIMVAAADTLEQSIYDRLSTEHGQMMSLLELIKARHAESAQSAQTEQEAA